MANLSAASVVINPSLSQPMVSCLPVPAAAPLGIAQRLHRKQVNDFGGDCLRRGLLAISMPPFLRLDDRQSLRSSKAEPSTHGRDSSTRRDRYSGISAIMTPRHGLAWLGMAWHGLAWKSGHLWINPPSVHFGSSEKSQSDCPRNGFKQFLAVVSARFGPESSKSRVLDRLGAFSTRHGSVCWP